MQVDGTQVSNEITPSIKKQVRVTVGAKAGINNIHECESRRSYDIAAIPSDCPESFHLPLIDKPVRHRQ